MKSIPKSGHSLLSLLRYRASSAALTYTVFLMALIIGTLSLFIFAISLNRQVLWSLHTRETTIRNCNGGIEVLLGSNELVRNGDTLKFSLFGNGDDTVLVSRIQWGLFERIFCQAENANYKYSKIAFVGGWSKEQGAVAIYLTNRGLPLSLAGDCLIVGDCYLPLQGISSGSIGGRYFTHDTLVHGKTSFSSHKLPNLAKALVENLNGFSQSVQQNNQHLESDDFDSVFVSFNKQTQFFAHAQPINLTNKQLRGNIVIRSDKRIVIDSTTYTEDILVIAPCIIILNGFKGSLQAFASDTIKVGSHVSLLYPSVLCVNKSTSGSKVVNSSYICIGDNSNLEGCIVNNSGSLLKSNAAISLGNKTKVIGLVYCNGLAELKGEVLGSVYANGFIVFDPTTIYENYLLDVSINAKDLPYEFVAPGLFDLSSPRKIVKWLK